MNRTSTRMGTPALDQFIKEMEKACRIGGIAEGKRSHIWNITGNKRDLYIAQDPTGRYMKLSLHASGRFRVAFHEPYHRELIDRGIVEPDANRAVTVWNRPEGEGKAAWLVVSILLPASFYGTPFDQADFSKATNLFNVDRDSALEICIFLSPRYSDSLEGRLDKIGIPVWYSDLGDAGTFSVVVRQQPFDPASLPKPITIPVEALHSQEDAPTDEAPIKSGLGCLLFNDPAIDGVMRIVEIGGVTMAKPTSTGLPKQ